MALPLQLKPIEEHGYVRTHGKVTSIVNVDAYAEKWQPQFRKHHNKLEYHGDKWIHVLIFQFLKFEILYLNFQHAIHFEKRRSVKLLNHTGDFLGSEYDDVALCQGFAKSCGSIRQGLPIRGTKKSRTLLIRHQRQMKR